MQLLMHSVATGRLACVKDSLTGLTPPRTMPLSLLTVNNAMTGLVGNISDALAGNKVDWEDWASSVLQSMQKIILNAMLVDSLRSTSNSGFSVQSAVCLGRAQALYLAVLRPALTTQQRQDFNLTQRWRLFCKPQRIQ